MLSIPIADDETLKSEFRLEQVVLRPAVLAGPRPIDSVVRTHDVTGACLDCILEWPAGFVSTDDEGL